MNQNSSTAGGWSWDGNPGGVIHFESQDWSGAGLIIPNVHVAGGRIQNQLLQRWWRRFHQRKFVVAAGSTLPDIDQLSGVIGQVHWDQNNVGGTHEMSFTLANATTVAFGFVVSTGTTTWNHVNSVSLKRLQ